MFKTLTTAPHCSQQQEERAAALQGLGESLVMSEIDGKKTSSSEEQLSSSSSSGNTSENSDKVEMLLPPVAAVTAVTTTTAATGINPTTQLPLNLQRKSLLRADSFEKLLLQLGSRLPEDSSSSQFFGNLQKLSLKHVSFANCQGFLRRSLESKELLEVDLSGSFENDEMALQFIAELSSFPDSQLKKLVLNSTKNLRGSTWKLLTSFILTRFSRLESLEISDCSLNEERFRGIINAIEELDRPVTLNELTLSKNPKIVQSLQKFVFTLTQSKNLRL